MQTLFESEIPLVAVSFRDNDSERLAMEAKAAGVDVAELRIDQFSRTDPDHVLAVIEKFRDLPILATVRAAEEGGDWTRSEPERLEMYRSIIPFVDGIDIELSSSEIRDDVVAYAQHREKTVVVSYHDFESTADLKTLEGIVSDAKRAGADYVKVATMAKSRDDLRTLAMLTLEAAEQGVIVIAMGAIGSLSRIFFPSLGSRVTYSFIGDRPVPGQLDFPSTFDALRRFYPDFNQQKIRSVEILEDA